MATDGTDDNGRDGRDGRRRTERTGDGQDGIGNVENNTEHDQDGQDVGVDGELIHKLGGVSEGGWNTRVKLAHLLMISSFFGTTVLQAPPPSFSFAAYEFHGYITPDTHSACYLQRFPDSQVWIAWLDSNPQALSSSQAYNMTQQI